MRTAPITPIMSYLDFKDELTATAKALSSPGKGFLAADESADVGSDAWPVPQ